MPLAINTETLKLWSDNLEVCFGLPIPVLECSTDSVIRQLR